MKKVLYVLVFLFFGCADTPKNNVNIEEIVTKLQKGEKINAPQILIDQAKTLINRSKTYEYELINSQTLQNMLKHQAAILIDTSSKGAYLLAHIDGAKHFCFEKGSLAPSGTIEWNKKNGKQEDFLRKLGNNPLIPIVFYVQKNSLSHQATPADIGAMWAKKMGYHRIYRLIGDLEYWKSQGFPISREKPKCCQ